MRWVRRGDISRNLFNMGGWMWWGRWRWGRRDNVIMRNMMR